MFLSPHANWLLHWPQARRVALPDRARRSRYMFATAMLCVATDRAQLRATFPADSSLAMARTGLEDSRAAAPNTDDIGLSQNYWGTGDWRTRLETAEHFRRT